MQLPANISPVQYLIPVVLFVIGAIYSRARRSRMNYVVKWGKERLTFPLPPPDTKLGVIRKVLADYTQLPPHSFKLVHAGAVMKDDNAPISSYGITEKSKIAIIGGGENSIPSAKTAPVRPTQESTITIIRNELDKVRKTLTPDVEEFLVTLGAAPTTTSSAPPPQPGAVPKLPSTPSKAGKQSDATLEHARLGELLLQSLLRLDAINAEGEWDEARKERKIAVKEVQALLDRLDGAWKKRAKV